MPEQTRDLYPEVARLPDYIETDKMAIESVKPLPGIPSSKISNEDARSFVEDSPEYLNDKKTDRTSGEAGRWHSGRL